MANPETEIDPVDAPGSRPRRVGVVTSDKMQKTRTVEVQRLVKHRRYGKYIRRTTRLKVHDEEQASREGDRVEVEFSRPLSKTKRWRLVRVLGRGEETQ